MKKTDETLHEAQKEAQVYRRLLEEGKIRLLPEKPAPKPTQKDEVERARP